MILFICIVLLNNKCNELENEFTIKISKLSKKIEQIQNEKLQDIEIEVVQNQLITPSVSEQQKIITAIDQVKKSEDKGALVSQESKQINKQSKEKSERNDNISFNFEKLFMENIFNKIGAIALVIRMEFRIFIQKIKKTNKYA